MANGYKTGGRKKGTPNKRTVLFRDAVSVIEEMGCDPLKGLCLIAMDKNSAPDIKIRANAELAQYIYPKRKMLEVTAPATEVKKVEYGWVTPKPSSEESNTLHSQASGDSTNAEVDSKVSRVQ